MNTHMISGRLQMLGYLVLAVCCICACSDQSVPPSMDGVTFVVYEEFLEYAEVEQRLPESDQVTEEARELVGLLDDLF